MSYSLVFIDKEDYLLCVSDGKTSDAESFVQWAMTILSKAQETGHTKLLIDDRTFSLDLTPLDITIFATHLERIGGAELGLRLAVISAFNNSEISDLIEIVPPHTSGSRVRKRPRN